MTVAGGGAETGTAAATAEDGARQGATRRRLALRAALEFGPLLVFFVANAIAGIYVGTAALMAAALASTGYSLLRAGRLPVLPLVGTVVVAVLGTATILFEAPWAIKLRPTIMNGGIALALLGGLAAGRQPLRAILGRELSLPERAWRRLTLRTVAYLLFLAVLNEVVWRNFSTDTWVAFKAFGITSLNLLFAASQLRFVRRHRVRPDAP